MSNAVNNNNGGIRVSIGESIRRQAPNASVGAKFKETLGIGLNAVMDAGQIAAPLLPGGAVLSAAISGVGTIKGYAAANSAAGGAGHAGFGGGQMGHGVVGSLGGTGVGGAAGGSIGSASGPASVGGVAQGDMMGRMEKMQEMNQSFNMQYLSLQQNIQNESRRFSLLSNIIKTRHDTAKNSIGNLR